MSDQVVQVATDGSGKKIDVTELTVGANTVQRQRVNLSDPTDANAHAAVEKSSAITGNEYGLVTHVGLLADMAESLKHMQRLMAATLAMGVDPSTGRLRALIDLNTAQTLGTVTTVSTVTTVTTVNQVAGFDAKQSQLYDASLTTWASQVRARIT